MDMSLADPKGLIRESYRIEGITLGECRSIFMDWALSVKVEPLEAMRAALATYGVEGHPMNLVIAEGLSLKSVQAERRGGRAARIGLSG